MDPISLALAGGSLLSGFFSAKSATKGQEEANAMNYQIAKENRDWQERMSSTAHQREVADLRAAGLNPILSATGGSGASSPGGSVAVMQNPNAIASDIMSTSARTASETSKNQSGSNLNSALTNKSNAEASLAKETVNTQKTQQYLNLANAKSITLNQHGRLGAFGSYVPLGSIGSALSTAKNIARSGFSGVGSHFTKKGE